MPTISRIGSLFVLPLMLVGLLAAGNLVSTPDADAAVRRTEIRRSVHVALNQIGDPYAYGAAGPNRFDCSGLLYFSYRKAGFRHMPRTSDAQARWLHKVRKSHLRRGDLMFFHYGSNVYHAAIFLKWNKHGRAVMLDSEEPGTRVHRRHPWTKEWFGRTLRH
jgi:cell wall-associated NlpC family hydrolase